MLTQMKRARWAPYFEDGKLVSEPAVARPD